MQSFPTVSRLSLQFPASQLLAEALAIDAETWRAHFNAQYHDGGWHGVALRSTGGDSTCLFADPTRAVEPINTPLLARCPAIAAALAQFQCPIRDVRLLRLAAGSVIREHCDPDLRFDEGQARLHIPLVTHPLVEFYVAGERVMMEAGECWFLELSHHHRVHNASAIERIHLVIDCDANAWLQAAILAGDYPQRTAVAPSGQEQFYAFKKLVWQDSTLQQQLSGIEDKADFAQQAVALGAARDLRFNDADVLAQKYPAHQNLATASDDASKLAGWVPVKASASASGCVFDFAYFGALRLKEPFFESSVQIAMRSPFNRAFRQQRLASSLHAEMAASHAITPTAFIFHASRCGSTLLSQMLSALPSHIVAAEPPPLDTLLREVSEALHLSEAERVLHVRALVAALAQPTRGETAFVIKMDAWTIFELPLLLKAFPDTPWIFLYRDPVEIAVSQMRQRASYMIPGVIGHWPGTVDWQESMTMLAEELIARIIGNVMEQAVKMLQQYGGVAMHYNQLPEAAWASFAATFGVPQTPENINLMQHAAKWDAKTPYFEFVADAQDKQTKATPLLREYVAQWAGAHYAALETLRGE
jgi:Aspartyl/Asparaginyl beta-hydroxylase/Sulfotransferase family